MQNGTSRILWEKRLDPIKINEKCQTNLNDLNNLFNWSKKFNWHIGIFAGLSRLSEKWTLGQ